MDSSQYLNQKPELIKIITKFTDPIQELFNNKPELIEPFTKNNETRATSWEIIDSEDFSFIIKYEFTGSRKITRYIFFKYLESVDEDYKDTIRELKCKSNNYSKAAHNIIYIIYQNNNVPGKNHNDLLFHDQESYGQGMYNMEQFTEYIREITH